jgi:hypothetical protein
MVGGTMDKKEKQKIYILAPHMFPNIMHDGHFWVALITLVGKGSLQTIQNQVWVAVNGTKYELALPFPCALGNSSIDMKL